MSSVLPEVVGFDTITRGDGEFDPPALRLCKDKRGNDGHLQEAVTLAPAQKTSQELKMMTAAAASSRASAAKDEQQAKRHAAELPGVVRESSLRYAVSCDGLRLRNIPCTVMLQTHVRVLTSFERQLMCGD